jgi:hypothetical protein
VDTKVSALPLSPYEAALARLTLLEQRTYPTKEDQKQLMFTLSHIIREYLELRFARPFMEETTYEIAISLPQFIPIDVSDEVLAFLRLLDPVKYADDTLSANELKGRMTLTRELLVKLEAHHGV